MVLARPRTCALKRHWSTKLSAEERPEIVTLAHLAVGRNRRAAGSDPVTAIRRICPGFAITELPDNVRRWRESAPLLPGRHRGSVGICASGGGIRSAIVVLGALQQFGSSN